MSLLALGQSSPTTIPPYADTCASARTSTTSFRTLLDEEAHIGLSPNDYELAELAPRAAGPQLETPEANVAFTRERHYPSVNRILTEQEWRMKFGTALLFNARPDWLDSYVDYEALKKAIPVSAPPPRRSTYTDLESSPLLSPPAGGAGDEAASHRPFFNLLTKELRKVSKFYEIEEGVLMEQVRGLQREIEEEEAREEKELGEDVIWENNGEDDEGQGTVGGLGVQVGTGSRGRLARSRSSFVQRNSQPSTSPTRDTAELFEAQQSLYANRLRSKSHSSQTKPRTSQDGENSDSSAENSPVQPIAQLPTTATAALESSLGSLPSTKRRNTSHSSANINNRRRSRRMSGSGSALADDDLGLVPVESNSLSLAPMSDSMMSDGFGKMVNVWTGTGSRATMLKIIYKRQIASVWLELNALRGFRDLNQEGVKKALKKFDKLTGSTTKDDYLENILPTFYPWLPEVKESLEVLDQILVSTYARVVVGGDKELAGRQLGSQLREKVVVERDTVWRQMVQSQRASDGAGLLRAVPDPRAATGFLDAELEKGAWKPFFKTPLGTIYLPSWLSKSGCIFAIAVIILIIMTSGAANTFDRIEEQNCLAMLVFCTILWATEAIPLFVTSLSVPFLVVVLRVLRSSDGKDTRLSAPDATKFIFSQMFSPTIMLLIGGFTIAAALSKTRMDVIMATRILNLAGTRPSVVLLSQMAVATFASMWISNVAAPTLCFALIKPITSKLPSGSNFTRCLIIAIALASNIGGMASPISSPQNLIALGAMEPPLDWLQWFAISLPVASCSVLLIWAFLHIGYRWESDLAIAPIKPHGDKFDRTHLFVAVVTLFTISLWCIEKNLEEWIGDMGIIAVIPLVAFFGTKILSKEDFHNFHWSIVFLAMGGIALGKAVLSSGLLDALDYLVEKLVDGLGLWQILAVFSVVVMIISTFISHTIAAVLLVPIASRIGESLEDPHPRLLIMATALICSAGMGLPVSGFPNMSAIAEEDSLGNRYLDATDFLKNGIPATVLATIVIISLGFVIMRILGL